MRYFEGMQAVLISLQVSQQHFFLYLLELCEISKVVESKFLKRKQSEPRHV